MFKIHLLRNRIAMALLLAAFCLPTWSRGEVAATDTFNGKPVTVVPDVRFYIDPFAVIPVQEHEVRAGLLYDIVNKKIVWQKNCNAVLPVASLTKMMVALLAIEDLREGKFMWSDTITWTRALATGRRSRRKVVNVTSRYTFQDVFKAMMIASDNQCAEQMATYIGNGDLQSTIQRMNIRALELGMTSTIYRNPSGLPASIPSMDNASSPVDQLILGLELLKYQEVLDITGMGYAQVNNGKNGCVIRNHNGLTIQHPGEIDGLKTGYTKRAGFCLVGTASKCNHRLIAVVLGCRGPAIRNEVVRNMFNNYYASIGVDPIGNYCISPAVQPVLAGTADPSLSGQWVTVRDQVKNVHVVRSGENLSKIAQRYHCSINQLKAWNRKKIPPSGRLVAGQSLAVFTATTHKVWMVKPDNGDEANEDQASDVVRSSPDNTPNDNPASNSEAVERKRIEDKFIYHVVAPGDTLYSIARRYGLPTVKELKDLNHIHDTRSLKPGMKLKVKVEG